MNDNERQTVLAATFDLRQVHDQLNDLGERLDDGDAATAKALASWVASVTRNLGMALGHGRDRDATASAEPPPVDPATWTPDPDRPGPPEDPDSDRVGPIG
jgi:hypothetical protein